MATLARWLPVSEAKADDVAPTTAAIPSELLALTRLDAREGITRIGGDVDAYVRQLRRFRRNYADLAIRLREQVLGGEVAVLKANCHALKAVVGNIGARALFEVIVEIDAGLKEGRLPTASVLERLDTLLTSVIADIDGLAAITAEGAGNAAAAGNARPVCELLLELQRALQFDLGAAQPLVSALQSAMAAELMPEFETIAAHIDAIEIDEALHRLVDFMKPLACGSTEEGIDD
jgi:HPt (histidine-containing phosphotransfer) domain-containing protein